MDGHFTHQNLILLLFSQPKTGWQPPIGEVSSMAQKSKRPVIEASLEDTVEQQGLGPDAAGQSGDLQGLSEIADADSESVEQLIEEGQALEADAVAGVEDAPDADVSEVRVRQRPADDVPKEYLDPD
jgi:uncharacterized protein YbjQ (UPF0145 family)